MKRLVLLVGIPGSGKTTLSKRLIERGFLRLCADDIRQELWGDAGEQKDPEKVFGIFFQKLDEAFARGLDVVVDNTNINTKHRQPILQKAITAGYEDIQLWVLDTPLEICLERNRNRERAVPDDIVANMYASVTGAGRPRSHEGKIIIVRAGPGKDEFKFFLPKAPRQGQPEGPQSSTRTSPRNRPG
jgi:predicted kinase